MAQPSGPTEPEVVREVSDVETLKALSDPIRLGIMRSLMEDTSSTYTVKEIAQRLGEPTTKLYRHMKVLEAADLIRVASTRMVSGIQESQYRVAQLAVRLSRDLLSAPGNAGELAEAFGATLDDFRERLVRDILAGRLGAASGAEQTSSAPTPMVVALDRKLSPERATEFRSRLHDLMEEFNRPDDDSAAVVPIEFLLMFWSPRDPD
ncbi:helix-turn-helix domain-containing protein [Actinoplanes sp. NPDC051346]|uniref:ArsR/SmtB family transcription factor n=1 Tax=Actinoplanes sp. NPDC051346 TaxID=3155048 RepID=UPI00344162EF